jgi:hypothetical protein
MQAKHRGKPNEEPVSDKCDVAEDGEDTQKAHILRQERQEHHRRCDVSGCIGQSHHGFKPFCRQLPWSINHHMLELAATNVVKRSRKYSKMSPN